MSYPSGEQFVTAHQLTRRAWLMRAGLVAAGSLIAACSPAAPAAGPTAAPAAKPTSAPAPAATTAPTAAPAAAAQPTAAAQAAAPTQAAPATGGKRGGKLTWALDSDPVHLIPYGAVPTQNHWGKE